VDPLYDPEKVETGLSLGAPALFMPDSAKNPMSQQGIVVSVGPEQRDIEVGDHVLYHPFIGTVVEYEEHEYLLLENRHIAGFLDPSGNLWPLPDDAVVRPDFGPAGRPVLEGGLWVPKQVFSIDIPCTGVILKRGTRVPFVEVGQRVLYPPSAGNEIGLRRVLYTIRGSDLLATIGVNVKVTVKVTPPSWESQRA